MAQSYLDYNLFNQIAQQSNYDRKVAQKQQDLEYATRLEERANKRVQEQMINQDKVAAYIEQLDEKLQGLLGPDQERLKALEKEKRKMILKGVADAQGDYRQFLLQGGASVLRDYKKSVLQSDEATYAFKNVETYKQIKEDMSKGHILKDVTATYIDDKGREVTGVLDVSDMLNMFFDGRIKNISYNGSQKPVELNPFEFAKTPNPSNPYQSDFVSLAEVRDFMILKGQDPEIATKIAQKYISFERDGQLYTQFQWGQKDMDFSGIDKMWNMNSGTRSGAKSYYEAQDKYGDYIGALLMQEGGNKKVRDWVSSDGKKKQRVSIEDVDIDQQALDAILQQSGLILTDDGYKGKVGNTIGFMNLGNGQLAKIGSGDYNLVSVGNKMKIVRDTKTGMPQMYVEAQIDVTEDYMEKHLGEGSWWNGWTTTSKTWGNVTKDVDVNGKDMRRITVGIHIPTSPMIRERMNQKIGWEQGQVKGGVQQQDYTSQYYYAPPGMDIQSNQQYRSMNGTVMSSSSPFGTSQGSETDVYQKAFSEAQMALQTNPVYSGLNQEQIRKFAHETALRVVQQGR